MRSPESKEMSKKFRHHFRGGDRITHCGIGGFLVGPTQMGVLSDFPQMLFMGPP